MNNKITQKELFDKFKYDQETGIIERISGKKCGTKHNTGYIKIFINGTGYYAHRLAWLWVHGYMPARQIDHINRDRIDNRIINLREADQSCNTINSGVRRDNSSGITGVRYRKTTRKWVARITINGKYVVLGQYGSIIQAARARLKAEKENGYSDINEFSSAREFVSLHDLRSRESRLRRRGFDADGNRI